MTEQTARRDLKAWRLQKRWSYETLFADMRAVLGRPSLSVPTLRRFEQALHKSHAHTIADIDDYLRKAKRKVAA